jgi:plasmid stabilization system protein ParE
VIRFRPAAARELAADVRYYDKRYAGRGQRFASAVERALLRIAESPLAFPLLIEPDIRSAKVERFPYRVVYVVLGADVDVLAVAHAKRRPSYWRRRIR